LLTFSGEMLSSSVLLEDCGFINHTAKDQQSVIYIKMVEGNPNSLDQMLRQKHQGSQVPCRSYATKSSARPTFKILGAKPDEANLLPHRKVHRWCKDPKKRRERGEF